jgi:hypothetical protein
MLRYRSDVAVTALVLLSIDSGCDKKDDQVVTPPIAASAILAPAPPAGPRTLRFAIDVASKTTIDMPAPKEHIRAETSAAAGDVTIDLGDLGKTRGQVKVDLATLSTHTFDNATKDKSQTEHAHNWLEAGDLVSPEIKETNRWAIFSIREVNELTISDLSKVPVTHVGVEDVRSVLAIAKGDFFLHGHQVVFHYATGEASTAMAPTKLEIRTKAPIHVVLADHDVKPRDNLGKLAQASFSILGTKVAETADVTLAVSATAAPVASPTP